MTTDHIADPPHDPNARALSKGLKLKYEDQTLAVYPAPLAPPPHAWPFPMDREAGIAAYRAMISADEHRKRRAEGKPAEHIYVAEGGESPVLQVSVSKAVRLTPDITLYEFRMPDGSLLPRADAGAHVDVVVAPEFFRQYSLSGDPADRSKYQIAVSSGRRRKGRLKAPAPHFSRRDGEYSSSHPINHFPLVEHASFTYLMGGGIGITPMVAMAHRLHLIGAAFELHYSCSKRSNAGFLDMRLLPRHGTIM